MTEVTIFIAFIAGIVSFLSPCVLPLLPAFLGYLAGTDVKKAKRWELFWYSLVFVLGFTAVFSLLGVLLQTVLAQVAYDVQAWLNRIAGVIITLFGFYLLGIFKPQALQKVHKFNVKRFESATLTSFVFGAAFAIGWTPCVGAVLASIIALAATVPAKSFMLLLAYSLGLGIPFLLLGLFSTPFMKMLHREPAVLKYFNIVVGIAITLLGVLVFTGTLAIAASGFEFLTSWLIR